MKLPGAARAEVPVEKLRDYVLSPDHPEGKHKARVFFAALGFTRADAELLRDMVLEAARTHDVTSGPALPYGQMYSMDFNTQGLHERVTIRTAWIVGRGTD